MNREQRIPGRNVRTLVLHTSMVLALAWSVALALSFWWYKHQLHILTGELTASTARSALAIDRAVRHWATDHGGVYVEADGTSQPEPMLGHLADRDLTTTNGRRLTLLSPAAIIREMQAQPDAAANMSVRLIGADGLNPANAPDEAEAGALAAFAKGAAEVSRTETGADGTARLRMIAPLRMQPLCRKCHDTAIADGAISGAVAVAIPLAPYQEAEANGTRTVFWSHLAVWLAGLAGLALAANRIGRRLADKARADEENRLAAQVFANALEAMVVTDAQATILRVNPAFTLLTGFSAAEVVGHKANVLRSHHHDNDFYQAMWQSLLDTGIWQGELTNRRKDGSIFVARESISAVRRQCGGPPLYYVASFADITSQVESQRHIAHLAHYDPLTDLPNRALFRDRLDHAIALARRDRRAVGVLFLDLDGFKRVNDTLGHRAGDGLLVEMAARLRLSVRSSDTISRLGGDEFAVVLERIDGADDAGAVAEKLLAAIAAPVTLDGRQVFVGGSIGISLFPTDGDNSDQLLRQADTAMYQAKADGKGRLRFYRPDMGERQERRMVMEVALRAAIAAGALDVAYQPKLALKAGAIAGFEALARWTHPSLGAVPPTDFIPLAEELGLITSIDLFVLRQACLVAVDCLERGYPVTMAVNLSSLDLKNPELPAMVADILRETNLPPTYLVLEITESFAMEMGQGQTSVLERLTALGVSLAIDDFGTGYSSLSYLKRLPVHSVKIDRSFVRDLGQDSRDTMLVSTIVGLAHSLNLTVVAEGVEDVAQKALLHQQQCDEAQGFLVARPMPAAEVLDFLAQATPT